MLGARRWICACALIAGGAFAGACGRDWAFLDAVDDGGVTGTEAGAESGADATTGQDAAVGEAAPDNDAEGGSPVDADAAIVPPDTGATEGGCSVDAPFGEPHLVDGVNTANEEQEATLSPDEKTIYFASGVYHATFDIYVATRTAIDAGFGPPALSSVSTPDLDIGASITGSGLEIFLDSYYTGDPAVQRRRIQRATRADAGAPFGPLTVVQELSSDYEEGTPYVLAGGDVMYFTSSRADSHFEIYRAERTAQGTWGMPGRVGAINDPTKYDGNPVVTSDERTIYFASSRDKTGYETDIYVAHRGSTDGGFDPPTRVDELSTPYPTNSPTWLSPDACRLYFASDRLSDAGTSGSIDLWVAERRP
jgi:hypothetical protein